MKIDITLNLREEYYMNPTSNSKGSKHGCPPSFFTEEGYDPDVRNFPDKYHKAALIYQLDGYWLEAAITYIKLAENELITDAERFNLVLSINQQFYMAYAYGDPNYAKPLSNDFNLCKFSEIITSLPYMDWDLPEYFEKVKPHLEKKAGVLSVYNKLIADFLSWLELETTLDQLKSASDNKNLGSLKLKFDNGAFSLEKINNNSNITKKNHTLDEASDLVSLELKINTNDNFARLPQQIKMFVLLELYGIITNFCLTTVDISDPDWGPPSLKDSEDANEKMELLTKRLELINSIWESKKMDMKIDVTAVVQRHGIADTVQPNINNANQGGWNILNCIIS